MKGWNVYYRGRLLDCVYFSRCCDAEYVRSSLVDHDGYPPSIKVRSAQ